LSLNYKEYFWMEGNEFRV